MQKNVSITDTAAAAAFPSCIVYPVLDQSNGRLSSCISFQIHQNYQSLLNSIYKSDLHSERKVRIFSGHINVISESWEKKPAPLFWDRAVEQLYSGSAFGSRTSTVSPACSTLRTRMLQFGECILKKTDAVFQSTLNSLTIPHNRYSNLKLANSNSKLLQQHLHSENRITVYMAGHMSLQNRWCLKLLALLTNCKPCCISFYTAVFTPANLGYIKLGGATQLIWFWAPSSLSSLKSQKCQGALQIVGGLNSHVNVPWSWTLLENKELI